ncbi:anti-sigma factor [Kribbella monticola]|uniref:anti-sigma factor n=1 Tax=Kribbella monticola TaxID=2185285 RepID=UPI000DD31162|nr:anti-sigma factor [Kribbella monticola]
MTHLDDETLAQWALDDHEPSPEATGHLTTCADCQGRLDELRHLADLSHDLPHLEVPPPEVWERIAAELDHEDGATRTTEPLAQQPSAVVVRTSRRALVLAASIAAILGLGAGVLGTRLIDKPTDTTTQAAIKLEPLEGKSGDGTADLVRVGTGAELRVTASGLPAPRGFYEVWLINQDGKRMVSLGVLSPGTVGTYQIPPDATGQGYRIVDISLEPDDGNPEHSHDSIIRGTLPT